MHLLDFDLTSFQSFNVVTQQDSRVLKNDSKSMKAIASVTMAFLPLATIAVPSPFPSSKASIQTLIDEVGCFRLSILQLRRRQREDPSRE